MKTGLVLEGGGMRGLYTIGVLDLLLENSLIFDYVIGVSAGASNAVSYLSGQKGRNLSVNLDFLKDKRYLSMASYLKTKSLFGMDFIFGEIPQKLVPFDFDAFQTCKSEFLAGATNVKTGQTEYFGKDSIVYPLLSLRASCSLPVFSPMVEINKNFYLDGGASDPIPVSKALADGCEKLVIVLTQPRGYQKKPQSFQRVYRLIYKEYPEMIKVLDRRHLVYNETLEKVFALEKERKAVVLSPSEHLPMGRFEKDHKKLLRLYELGKKDATAALHELKSVSASSLLMVDRLK